MTTVKKIKSLTLTRLNRTKHNINQWQKSGLADRKKL